MRLPSKRTIPSDVVKPRFLLADSQPLFDAAFMARVQAHLPREGATATYLGHANDKAPEFKEIFAAAIARIDATEATDIDHADLIVLAGGDTKKGWAAFEAEGLVPKLHAASARGAVLLGISAGAIHLGVGYLGLVRFGIGAHDEPDWKYLSDRVREQEGTMLGIGVPKGGAAIVHASGGIESHGPPLVGVALDNGEISLTPLVVGS